jgi:endonuclease G, mitochondrial
MQPQTHRLNAGAWKSLETYVRKQVTDFKMEAYMYAGCYGDAGRIKDKITIPTHCWKIAILLPVGNNDLRRITRNTRVIAVNMENTRTTISGWRNHLVTVDELEQLTGYDFLAPLDDEIENAIESRRDDAR